MKEINIVPIIWEYFRCVIGDTAGTWSYNSSRSRSDMLRVWFSCLFVPNECGVKMAASLEVYIKVEQYCFLVLQKFPILCRPRWSAG
jgi:hypothetical protein